MSRVLAMACVLALAGCAGLPSDEPPAMAKPLEAYASSRSLAAASGEWPAQGWWKRYRDAQLDALIDEALAGSPSIAIAQARLRKAQAAAGIARAGTLPEVNATAAITQERQSYNYLSPPSFTPHGFRDYGYAALDFSWELDFWGRNRAALAAATSEAEAARAEAAQARITLSTAIASAYAELARLHAARDTAAAALDVRTQTTTLFRTRRANGLETLGSVRQVEARRAAAEADVLALDEQLALQRNRIAALLGAGPDRGLAIAPPAVDLAHDLSLPASIPAHLLGRRPDIVAARLRAEASVRRIDQARAAFYPDVNLAAFIGVHSLGLGHLFESAAAIGSIGPAISLPIFAGGRLEAQLSGARADQAEAVANYERTLVQALQDVADAATSRKALDGQLARTNEAVDAARDAWQIQKNRYDGGLASYLDVLAAEDNLLASVRSLTDLQSRSFALDVAMVRALGGGYADNPTY